MAGEIQLAHGITGRTLYAHVRNGTGSIWNGSAFASYSAGNYATYTIAMTEQGATGYYVGTMPAVSVGTYAIEVLDRVGGSVAVGDPVVGAGYLPWTGTAIGYPNPTISSSDAALAASANFTRQAQSLYRGEDRTITINFGTGTNVTGWSLKYTAALEKQGTPTVELSTAAGTLTIVSATQVTGAVSAAVAAALTAQPHFWDIWRMDSGYMTLLGAGQLTVNQPVRIV